MYGSWQFCFKQMTIGTADATNSQPACPTAC
jgi:hypothetical protein